ncbi:mitochondrial fission factor-like isoform X2 [Siniperca chuatsi]|uniref:mitochondrial fission factor-like isoform X2 n=1 Tax=Siniperca chuatsi TaxID=119488 RepID=UPI001CE1A724|nr:mitochondrial fission factor-like isoform X2 [Siniperca chuatsi]
MKTWVPRVKGVEEKLNCNICKKEMSWEMSQVPGRDPAFMEAINENMRVPEHLSISPRQQWQEEEEREEATRRPEGPPPAYTMQVPDRLTYAEAPDMSPRPPFTSSKLTICGPLGLEPCWESPSGEVFYREAQQSPIRRTYSDQSLPPTTPTQLKKAPALPRHPYPPSSGRPLHQHSTASLSAQTTDPQAQAQPLPATSLSLLFPQSILQAAKHLGLQASQRVLQTVSQKYRAMENWSPQEEGGAAVEFIILRRQVMKMSRRLAALERHNTERRNTEVVLFSLLFSACLLNVWLWIRR